MLPLVQSVLINTPSGQRACVPPVRALTGLDATPVIANFYRSSLSASALIPDVDRECILNCEQLCRVLADLWPVVQSTPQKNRERQRNQVGKGRVPTFTEGDFVLVARDEFDASEKLSLCWRDPRRVIRPVNDFVYQIEDWRIGALEDVHATLLTFSWLLFGHWRRYATRLVIGDRYRSPVFDAALWLSEWPDGPRTVAWPSSFRGYRRTFDENVRGCTRVSAEVVGSET